MKYFNEWECVCVTFTQIYNISIFYTIRFLLIRKIGKWSLLYKSTINTAMYIPKPPRIALMKIEPIFKQDYLLLYKVG